jgi:hypothetical protein
MPSQSIANNCVCRTCGREFHQKPSRIAAGKGLFCSKPCIVLPRTPLADRFFAQLGNKTPLGCILWAGATNDAGYGVLGKGGRGGGMILAHRLSWELANGPVPDGLFVLHRCDNPPCVNAGHLFVGTDQDNHDDCVSKGRQSRGEQKPNSKLTSESVHQIRCRRASGESMNAIARSLEVDAETVRDVVRGVTWKHVV